jgi:hypothetical protein
LSHAIFVVDVEAARWRQKNSSVSSKILLKDCPLEQGCQIILGPKYRNGGKYTKLPQNISNGRKIFPKAVK